MTVPTNWYENFFYGLSLDLWRKAISPKQTKSEADFLIKVLEAEKGSHLFDVPCGNGRLSLALARLGYQVTGMDISKEFIEEARAAAAAVPALKADFISGDMCHVKGEEIYDGAYCFGNSFGFLKHSDMESFLGGICRALKPGARFIVETGMAAESVLHKFEPLTIHQIGDISVTIKEQYLAEESCIDTEYTFEREGQTQTNPAKHWIYTVGEIRRMLERAGFQVLNLYGSRKRIPYTLGAEELIVVAQRGKS